MNKECEMIAKSFKIYIKEKYFEEWVIWWCSLGVLKICVFFLNVSEISYYFDIETTRV